MTIFKKHFYSIIGVLLLLIIVIGNVNGSLKETTSQTSDISLKLRPKAIKTFDVNIPAKTDVSYIIVKFNDESGIRISNDKVYSRNGNSLEAVKDILQGSKLADVRRLFDNIAFDKLDREREILQYKTKFHTPHVLFVNNQS